MMEAWTYLPMAAMAGALLLGGAVSCLLPPGHPAASLVDTLGD